MRPILLAPLLLVACHGNDTAPGATSPSEDRALNEAAAMLDANSVDANALPLDNSSQDQPQ